MFSEKAENAIPSEWRMISGCEDKQTSADVSNVSSFQLPDPAGRAGGACTSALLNVLYKNKTKSTRELTFREVLLMMRVLLSAKDFEQIPQLSSSRNFDLSTKFDLAPEGFNGTKRAVMIGINYVGQDGELSGCHNDVLNMKEYLMDVHGFKEENITLLLDDRVHINPTYYNMINAYQKIVKESEPGDVVFLHYSGHGGRVRDNNGDEKDGHDETLIPVDYMSRGQIRDDDLLKNLVLPMKKGVFVTSVMDCCHSGTVLDLPYNFKADGEQDSMEEEANYDFDAVTSLLEALGVNSSIANALSSCCVIS